jgi:thiol-disulfide isomerase/thioredoxin
MKKLQLTSYISIAFILLMSDLFSGATLDGVRFGKYVSGKKLTEKSLQGKIVLFEYWGVNCPPCLRAIPNLKKYQEKYGDSLVIIANQCQGADEKKSKKVWESKGGGKEISVINFGSLPGSNVRGLPRCFLFDENKKLIFDGSPFSVEEKIAGVMKNYPGALVAGKKYKYLKKEATALGKRSKSFSSVLKTLERKKTDKNTEVVEEAKFLISRVNQWAEDQKENIGSLYKTDPIACESELKSVIKTIGSHDLCEWFKVKQKETKGKEYRNELTAFRKFVKWKESLEKAGYFGKPSEKALKYLPKYIKSGESIIKKYEGTIAANQAVEIIGSLQ